VMRAPGMIHGFLTMDPFLPDAARAAIGRIAGFMADRADRR
jgi:acetyl esterase/lipase